MTPTPGLARQSSRTSAKQPVDYIPHIRYHRRYKRHSTAVSSSTGTNSDQDQSSVPVRGEEVEMKDASIMMDLLSSHPCVDHETAAEVQEEEAEEETRLSKKRKSTTSTTHIDQQGEEDEIETDTDDTDASDGGGGGSPLRKRVKRTRPTIPHSSHESEESKEQPTTAAAGAATHHDQVMMTHQDEVKGFDQKKRSLVVSRPMVKCPTCEKVCPMSQMRVLPCTRIICRSCGIKKVSENKQKSTIYCRDCGDDHILARFDLVMTPGDVIDRCPTMKQSKERLLASHDSNQRRPLCSYSGCGQLALYLCPDGCGHLCEEHRTTVHEYQPGHQSHLISLESIERKKAILHVEQTKAALATLDEEIERLGENGQVKLGSDMAINKCLHALDSQIQTVENFLARDGPQIVSDLHHLKQAMMDTAKEAEDERHQVLKQLRERATQLRQSRLLSTETTLTVEDDEFRELVHGKIIRLSDDAKQPPTLPPPPRLVSFIYHSRQPAIGPALTPDLLLQLEAFLKASGKSLNNSELLYKASCDGWSKAAFLRKCQGKSGTLVLVKVAAAASIENDRSSYLFGAYIAPPWPGAGKNEVVRDESMKSFLFSLTNPSHHPIRLSLTKPTSSAIDLSAAERGPAGIVFGEEDESTNWSNITLFYDDRPANHPHGICINDQDDASYAYQLDGASEPRPDGLVLDDKTFCGRHFCGATEIEVYQLA